MTNKKHLVNVAMNLLAKWKYLSGSDYRIFHNKGYKPITIIEKGGYLRPFSYNSIPFEELKKIMHSIWVNWLGKNPETGFIGI